MFLLIVVRKKRENCFGCIEIANSHSFCSIGSSIYSPYLTDLCLFIGQEETYDKGGLLLEKLA